MSRGLWRLQTWVQHTDTSSHPPQNQDTYRLQDSICRCLPDEATLSGPVLREGQIWAFKTSRWVRAGTSREAHSTAAIGQGPSAHMVVNKRPLPPLLQDSEVRSTISAQLLCKLLQGCNVSCILLGLATLCSSQPEQLYTAALDGEFPLLRRG